MLLKNLITLTSLLFLTACASNNQSSATAEKLERLSAQVNQLSLDVNELKSKQEQAMRTAKNASEAAEEAKRIAEKAEQRVNNMVSSYKK